MRISTISLAAATMLTLLAVGCAGPEHKLGRGITDVTEFGRLGELRRSVEQNALWHNPSEGYTYGFIHGFDRSVARTAVGIYEVATFPFPSYDPIMHPVDPVYPDSYKPGLLADPLFTPNNALGFGGGDVAPFVPGSRFKIFGQ